MKIWFVEIGEPLPLETGVRPHRYGNFCKYLAQQGHKVTWWTSSFSHMPKKHMVESSQVIDINGYELNIIYGGGYQKNVSWDRIKHNQHFAQEFFKLAVQHGKPDLIVCPIPTIENAMACLKIAKMWRLPIVADIRDEWPDELLNILPKKLRVLGRIALSRSYRRMKKYCLQVDGIMAVSKTQLNYGLDFAHRRAGPNDFVFPLGYPRLNVETSELDKAREKLQQAFKHNEFKLNVCFFGTLGRYFEFDSLAEAAKSLPDVGFIVAGDGDCKNELTDKLQNLKNLYLPGWVNSAEIAAICEICHVGLAPYIGSEAFSMPNKIYEYLAHGLAVAATIEGDFKDHLKDNEFGFHFQPEDGEQLALQLRYLKNNPDALLAMQQKAKKLFNEKLSHEVIFPQAEAFLLSFDRNRAI